MFYSHEILTNRKYGIATIWLVATLGSKSNTKKLSRKAICDVNLKKACSTISEPEAPMALRLQSNLLYGVVRVYSQQCDYVLQDAQAAQATIRTLYKVSKANEINLTATKAKPDQIMVLDDPAFLPDFELPPLQDFELLSLNFNKNSQRSSQSMMSVQRERSGSVSSMSVAALNFPSSSRNSMLSPYQLPNDDPFALSSAHKPIIGEDRGLQDDELLMYNDEMPFEFDEAGNLRDISPAEINARRAGTVANVPHRLSSSAASGRVRADHAVVDFAMPDYGDGDFGIQYGRDDELPDAEPFSQLGAGNKELFMSGGLQRDDQPLHLDVPDLVSSPSSGKRSSEDPSFDSAEAPNKRRKTRTKKKLSLDDTLMLVNEDLRRMRDTYLESMAKSIRHRDIHKGVMQAKRNAQYYVFGTGIMGVGNGLGSFGLVSSLQSFSGGALMAKITGIVPSTTNKRHREDTEKPEQDNRSPKRAREDDEVGRGNEEQPIYNFDDDMPEEGRSSSGVEIGRDAQSALPDFHSSAMPWNVSASLNSRQQGLSSRRPGSMISAGRKMTESPLIGRGSALPGNLDHLSQLNNDDDDIMYGRDDNDDFQSLVGGNSQPNFGLLPSPQRKAASTQDFELFGPAAAVDTQTAGTSQWVRQALDIESENFLEYVEEALKEKRGDELEGEGGEGEDLGARGKQRFVTFGELVQEDKHNVIVATQAFYHVLTLATRGRIWAEQVDEEVMGGEIRVGVVG